ncbi:hypothetical protein [Pseudomonas syringae group genomosp. 3]|uniref:hypothetical protein n=1 Tax=Pseudomonas syringae group genomosp. 3 TaxID=251701 RepID=UPI000F00E37A|nr:hypothetical protein [Pseudomonas syringae group genomosp. 3]QQN26305.1 hypothetical protein JHZ65_22065 [Pseudomonas syringae pv. maculicola]
MWLGDISRLPTKEQYYLRSENVISDHCIGSEFYDGQIECIFTDLTPEDKLFKERSNFIESFYARFGTKVSRLDQEVLEISLSITRPTLDTPTEQKKLINNLYKVYVESLDKKILSKAITSNNAQREIVDIGVLQRLKLLIAAVSSEEHAIRIMQPLFLLQDLRLIHAHTGSAASKNKKINVIKLELELEESSTILEVHDALIAKLRESFHAITSTIE